jgi:hypothetical protein
MKCGVESTRQFVLINRFYWQTEPIRENIDKMMSLLTTGTMQTLYFMAFYGPVRTGQEPNADAQVLP